MVKAEEPKVPDPSINIEPDLRLTIKEWVLYWKTRYENSLEKIQAATKFIEGLRDEMKKVQAHNVKLQAEMKAIQEQYNAEVAARQAQQTEGKPDVTPKAEEFETLAQKKAKGFKRKKK